MSMSYNTTIPPGKAAGCLPRKTRFADKCRAFSDAIEVIPRAKWPNFIAQQPGLESCVTEIFDQDGVGCHDDKTEVLTEVGWQKWSDYDRSSALATVNPVTHALEYQLPTAFHAYEYSGPMHSVEHRSTSFCVTPNHRMYVRPWIERQRRLSDTYEMCHAEHVGWYAGMLASPSGLVGTHINALTVGNRTYTGDDFLALVALVASDGWAGGSESTWDRVSFCCFREDRIDMVRALAAKLGFREQPNRPGVFDLRNAPDLAAWFRANIFTTDVFRSTYKRIPQFIKEVSKDQTELFLRYYGDQHVSSSDRRSFYTSSKRMADDIQELLMHVGKRSGICTHQPRGATMHDGRVINAENCSTAYTVSEWTTDNVSIEKKKIDVEPYKGMVFCATVPNSILVTRRDNKILVSGNSCASESTTQALQIARAFAGREWVQLSPWFMYHTVSGGRDSGSSIDENLEFAREHGIAPMSLWPREKGWKATPSTEAVEAAKLYRIDEYFDIASIEEFGTALLLGMPVVYGRQGHAICAVELLDKNTISYANSWDKSWGMNGFGEDALSSVNFSYGAFAIRTATEAA
jgi:hypothetical protein